jgi:rod shape-determining protein MreC
MLVNRGGQSTVYKSQPVVTGEGVLGQVLRIGPFSSEIILITDSEHMLPVQVLRSGVRTIALGTGRSTALDLPYVPQTDDVKEGDLLVTSGLAKVFPFGLPVGRVTKITRDPTQPLAHIEAVPLAKIDSNREVLFIWSRPNHPAAPASDEALNIPVAKPAPKPAAPKRPRKPPAAAPANTAAPAGSEPTNTAPTNPTPTNQAPTDPPPTEPPPANPAPDVPAEPVPENAEPDGPETPPAGTRATR